MIRSTNFFPPAWRLKRSLYTINFSCFIRFLGTYLLKSSTRMVSKLNSHNPEVSQASVKIFGYTGYLIASSKGWYMQRHCFEHHKVNLGTFKSLGSDLIKREDDSEMLLMRRNPPLNIFLPWPSPHELVAVLWGLCLPHLRSKPETRTTWYESVCGATMSIRIDPASAFAFLISLSFIHILTLNFPWFYGLP